MDFPSDHSVSGNWADPCDPQGHAAVQKVFKKYDNLNSSIQENIKAMRVVKSFVREDYEEKKFGTAAEDVCADFTKADESWLSMVP